MASTPSGAPSQSRRRQSSRLQQRAPASLQVSRSQWNIAIPLLSPLTGSPTSPKITARLEPPANDGNNASAEVEKDCNRRPEQQPEEKRAPTPVFKTWQHPAAPFAYDPASLLPFMPV